MDSSFCCNLIQPGGNEDELVLRLAWVELSKDRSVWERRRTFTWISHQWNCVGSWWRETRCCWQDYWLSRLRCSLLLTARHSDDVHVKWESAKLDKWRTFDGERRKQQQKLETKASVCVMSCRPECGVKVCWWRCDQKRTFIVGDGHLWSGSNPVSSWHMLVTDCNCKCHGCFVCRLFPVQICLYIAVRSLPATVKYVLWMCVYRVGLFVVVFMANLSFVYGYIYICICSYICVCFTLSLSLSLQRLGLRYLS